MGQSYANHQSLGCEPLPITGTHKGEKALATKNEIRSRWSRESWEGAIPNQSISFSPELQNLFFPLHFCGEKVDLKIVSCMFPTIPSTG